MSLQDIVTAKKLYYMNYIYFLILLISTILIIVFSWIAYRFDTVEFDAILALLQHPYGLATGETPNLFAVILLTFASVFISWYGNPPLFRGIQK